MNGGLAFSRLVALALITPLLAPARALFCVGLGGGVRVNKALRATHSRREADKIIADGRVLVNGQLAQPGDRLVGGERVELDGRAIDWERLNVPAGTDAEDPGAREGSPFAYLKYWKPAGVETTTNRQIRGNIIDELGPIPGVEDRIVPVGRLDLASTGLILLTSDGGCINGLLRASEQKEKVYLVELGMRATDEQVVQLCEGVVITTVSQRDGVSKPLTAATRPCIVDRVSPSRPNALRFVLQEGRNRQIRRMCVLLRL